MCIKLAAVASFFLSLKDSGTQGFDGFLLLLGAGRGYGCGADCRAGGGPGFRCVLLCLQIMRKIKILNSMKTKSTLSFCRRSL